MEGPIDNPIPVSPDGPLGPGADVVGGWCTRCGAEYRPGFTRCADCGIDLAAEPPPPKAAPEPATRVDPDRHDVVSYDLREWTYEQYAELSEQLTLDRIPFDWRGGELSVPGAHEAHVDDLVDAIDELATVEDELTIEYEFADWLPQQVDRLVLALVTAGINCRWDGVLLAVAEADEATVDQLVVEIDPTFPVG